VDFNILASSFSVFNFYRFSIYGSASSDPAANGALARSKAASLNSGGTIPFSKLSRYV
jgi:hypothetical protein